MGRGSYIDRCWSCLTPSRQTATPQTSAHRTMGREIALQPASKTDIQSFFGGVSHKSSGKAKAKATAKRRRPDSKNDSAPEPQPESQADEIIAGAPEPQPEVLILDGDSMAKPETDTVEVALDL